jgi:hypothetical protein
MSQEIIEVGNLSYLPDVQAIIAQGSSGDAFVDGDTPIIMGEHRVAPWGESNDMPSIVMEKIGKSDAVGSNVDHNIKMMYGQGVKPFMKIVEGREIFYDECKDERVLKFYEENDITGFYLEQCADMAAFYNSFPEIILTKDLSEVYSLQHKEAAFSRWGVADKNTGNIIKHFYSSEWAEGKAGPANTTVSDVLNRINPLGDLRTRIDRRQVRTPRFIIPTYFPTPGRLYYQRPNWYSIFNSGSYDYSAMIWLFKKALMKNGLKTRYIIYVSDKYWDLIFTEEKIARNNPEKIKERKATEFEKFRKFLSDEENAGKGMMVMKKLIPSGNSAIEEKYIVIEKVEPGVKGGEFLEDSSEVNNTMSYAMQVFPGLIGPTPGKSLGSMSGTDKRELFHIKLATMAPYRDRLLRPLYLVKAFNKFPANLVWKVVDFEFTTLDKNKSGKQETTTNEQPKEETKK